MRAIAARASGATRLALGTAVLITLAAGALAAPPADAAQLSRTWVSATGSNANPCTAASPCRTFSEAIFKTIPGGEVNVLNSGDYGQATIDKAITIDGAGANAVIESLGNGLYVAPGASDTVILRNLTIAAPLVTGVAGVMVQSGTVLIDHVFLHDVSRGVDVSPTSGTARVVIRNSSIANAWVGLDAEPGPMGLASITADGIGISSCLIAGVKVEAGGQVSISRSLVSDAPVGLAARKAGQIIEPAANIFDRVQYRSALRVAALPVGATQFSGPKRKAIGLRFSPTIPVAATATIKVGTKTIATLKKNLKAADGVIIWDAKNGKAFAGAGTYTLSVSFKSADDQTDTFNGSIKLT